MSTTPQNLNGKRVTLVGLGQTAVSVAALLLQQGAVPFVTDASDSANMTPYKERLLALDVAFETGGHTDAAFASPDLIIPSPGVSPQIAPILEATKRGVPVIGEMEFSFPYCRSKVLAVTGTNGKTTTTELLRAMIAACGNSVVLAGNNAFPFSSAVLIEPAPEYIVLEVSSYQLELAHAFRPWIGAVLNLSPDHLQRHRTMAEYARCKQQLIAHQQPNEIAVLNADDAAVSAMAQNTAARVAQFSLTRSVDTGLWLDGDSIREGSTAVASLRDSALRGRHNAENIFCALTMLRAGGFAWHGVLDGLREFTGVEHRIEYVRSVNGVAYYNDSKSTNIDSLRVALESFDEPIVLLAGGRGKGSDYSVLRPLIEKHVKALLAYGEDASLLKSAFEDVTQVNRVADLRDGVEAARRIALPGDVVLLSPACASFDMFENFEHRGMVFKQLVHDLKEKSAP